MATSLASARYRVEFKVLSDPDREGRTVNVFIGQDFQGRDYTTFADIPKVIAVANCVDVADILITELTLTRVDLKET